MNTPRVCVVLASLYNFSSDTPHLYSTAEQMRAPQRLAFAGALLLAAVAPVFAHGDEGMNMDMGMGPHNVKKPFVPTYFKLDAHVGTIYAHIVLSVLAWIVVLPLGK